MKPYRLHAFVCLGKRCLNKGSEEILEDMKGKVKAGGLKGEVKVSRSGCLSVCKETDEEGEYSPAMVVYPEGVWYRNITLNDVDEIIERHFRKGEIIERLLHYRLGSKTA
ncbi:MAG: (2Fe-2S) ferredoxin domain-containing protein [Thermodesulfobacteriota bacterium]|nr:MAG: (2Fe-2S) ferredoxin domain-containing protein [Thermodesulfobacteriota bacterium]